MPPCQVWAVTFLSTLSLRRATVTGSESQKLILHFYPRSPCGERPLQPCYTGTTSADFYPRSPCGERQTGNASGIHTHWISIHALLAESDYCHLSGTSYSKKFLSTLSLRRATSKSHALSVTGSISIHALLAESDQLYDTYAKVLRDFYPRSPCGERPRQEFYKERPGQFLSTLSLRRATCIIDIIKNIVNDFYPRSPCGERHQKNLNP